MRIIVGQCPMHAEITAFFKIPEGQAVIFSWGDAIYNPTGAKISRMLVEHEEVHSTRQGRSYADISMWWRRYMADPVFRYTEELPAHIAEYKAYCKRHGSGREKYLHAVVSRLSSELYGNIIGYHAAWMDVIEGAAAKK